VSSYKPNLHTRLLLVPARRVSRRLAPPPAVRRWPWPELHRHTIPPLGPLQLKPTSPRAPSHRAAHPTPLPVAWKAPERCSPWLLEPAAMAVHCRPSLRPPPSKVSSPTCSPWSPLRFPLLTLAPRPPGRRRSHPQRRRPPVHPWIEEGDT
jgi:hypothetical protein